MSEAFDEFATGRWDFALAVTGSACCVEAIRKSLTILPEGYSIEALDQVTPAR